MSLRIVAVVAALGVVVAACSSGTSSTFNGGDTPDGGVPAESGVFGGDGNTITDAPIDPDAFFATDPPPMWCGVDGGAPQPPAPGGTLDCPDDKNREGCPCPTVGQQVACWPGLRANRNLGQCKDGTTTCTQVNEFKKVWGACNGYTLPTPGATKGKAACKCFSAGMWKLDNLSPCFVTYPNGDYAVSTYIDANAKAQCPMTISPTPPPQPQPGTTWTTDTLQVDCEGHFKLCYTLKAGAAATPNPTDCVVDSVCTEADYATKNVVQKFPDLPSWTGTDSACATAFANTGGYGEMSVVGLSVRCDKIDDGSGQPEVFNRVQYCPLSCNTPSNPPDPKCANCGQGGGGGF